MSITSLSGFDYFEPSTAMGTLTISGVNMHTYGWNVLDVRDLWTVVAVRGQDRLVPGVSGLRAKRRRITATTHSLPMVISGLHTPAGIEVTDPDARIIQFQDNLDYLMTNVVAPVATTAGTRAASLTMPSGGTRTANIHVLSITPGTWTPAVLRCTLDISIPGGKFT
jgi:hypothetical protein